MCLTLRSSIGRKILMAISGIILLGFVILHLLGNLQIFLGPEVLNAYAIKLRHFGPLLWIARGLLLVALVVHLCTSVQLTIENRQARPQPYAVYRPGETTLAARTMMCSGILLASFVIYHLLHFTFRVAHPELVHAVDAHGSPDVYRMVVRSFEQWPISLVYLVGVGAVCLHVSHGIGSSVQTLGLATDRAVACLMQTGRLTALAIFIGYASIPIAVLCGVLRPNPVVP